MGCGATHKADEPQAKDKKPEDAKGKQHKLRIKIGKPEVKKEGSAERAGGHDEAFKFLPDGTLLKAGKKKELEFFEEFKKTDGKYYAEMTAIKPYAPEFFGIVEQDGKKWIKMKDATFGLKNVSILDIKMSDKSYEPDATPEKIRVQSGKDKASTTYQFGFRLVGMVIRDDKGQVAFNLKKQLKDLQIDQVSENLKKFFMCNNKDKVNVEAVKFYIAKVKELIDIYQNKITRGMVASSLFFVLSNTDNKFDLKIIDFAHVFPLPAGKRDEGYIKGLNSVLSFLQRIQQDAELMEKTGAQPGKRMKQKGGSDNLAGGHPKSFQFMPDGTMLKLSKGTEFEFYQDFKKPDSKYYGEVTALKPYIPEFFDIVDQGAEKWLKMQNVTHGYNNFSIMDIKMGNKTYGPKDSAEKIGREIMKAKLATTYEYGIRLTGMVVKNEKGDTIFNMQKEFKELKYDEIGGMIKKFLMCNGKDKINAEAVKFYISRLKEILPIFQKTLRRYFVGGSFFFVLSNADNKFDLRIIDFAQVYPLAEGEVDDGYIKGIQNLISIFEKLQHYAFDH